MQNQPDPQDRTDQADQTDQTESGNRKTSPQSPQPLESTMADLEQKIVCLAEQHYEMTQNLVRLIGEARWLKQEIKEAGLADRRLKIQSPQRMRRSTTPRNKGE